MIRIRGKGPLLGLAVAAVAALGNVGPAQAADAPTSLGREFWIAFAANVSDTTAAHRLNITSPVSTSGTVEIPGVGFSAPFTVTANQTTSITVPPSAVIQTADGVEQTGIHITAGAPVAVYPFNSFGASTDAYLALPVGVLGKDYLALSFRNSGAYPELYGTQFEVVASQDDTTVTITPSAGTAARPAGVPYTVNLSRGDVYQLQDHDGDDADLTGSSISADKPVAVLAGNRIAYAPTPAYYAGDHMVEQMIPTNAWGKSALTVPLKTRSSDLIRVLAQSDNTTVTIDGVPTATIDRGGVYESITGAAHHITADKPVLVGQYSLSSNWDNTSSLADPFEMLIPPAEQFLNDYTVATPPQDFPTNELNLVIPTTAAGTILLDGSPVPASAFTPIADSEFSGAQVDVSVGSHHLQSATPFGVYSYGYKTYDGYGYPGGLSLAPVAAVVHVTADADSPTPQVGTQDCFTATVTDVNGQPIGGVRVDFGAAGVNSAGGFAIADENGHARFCYTGTNEGQDDITANVGTVEGSTSVTWQVSAVNQPPHAAFTDGPSGPSSGEPVAFDGSGSSDPDGSISSYSWDFGDGTTGTGPTPSHTYEHPGDYTVRLTVTDNDGATDSVQHSVSVENRPPTAAFTDSPAAPKTGQPVAFDGSGSSDPDGSISSYSWDFGDGTTGTGATPSHTYEHPGDYTVKLTVTDNNGATDSVQHAVTVATRRTGEFICRATAVRLPLLGEIAPSTANPAATPCRKADTALITLAVTGLPKASVLAAKTAQQPATLAGNEPKPGDNASADAGVAGATLLVGTNVITVAGASAHADATCNANGGVTLTGRSEVAALTVNGKTYKSSELGVRRFDIPLFLATLHVNSTVTRDGKVTQRVLWLESPLTGDLVLSEAIAGTTGGVCG